MSKRQRGVVLTERGKERLEAAIASAQKTEKYGKGFTQEGLSERAKLGVKTIKKIRAQIPADKTSVQTLFKAFDLELEAADYGLPEPAVEQSPPLTNAPRQPRLDWAEVPDVSIFYGRETELATLEQSIVADRCRLVALLGMGGIGKTSIAARVSRCVRQDFDYVIWRSLREAPPLEKILLDCIKFFSDQRDLDLPDSSSESATKLVRYFQQSRCLLVLDNAESILQGGTQAGQYRPGYEGYGTLLQRVGESQHQSCLLLTSREQPPEVVRLKGRNRPVRSHPLHGLDEQAGEQFLRAEGLAEADTEWKQVFDTYSGNPLALKIAANSIQDLFAGNIAEFLQQGTGIFGDIRDLLQQQFERLSQREQTVMYWLTINREPTSIAALQEDILEPISTPELLETLESLRRRSLVERTADGFTLQNVVMEYLTDRFVSLVAEDLKAQTPNLFHRHALMQATAKDYVRESQIRLILQPIAAKLPKLDLVFINTLKTVRQESTWTTGYAPGNLLNLLCQLEIGLSQADFSNLTLRHIYLKDVKLQNINFVNSQLINPRLTYTFGAIKAVAFSLDGNLLLSGDSHGEVHLWHAVTGQFLKTFQGHIGSIRSVAFSPDATILASGSSDATMRLWHTKTGQCLYNLQGHTNEVRSVVFSPDGKCLASGGSDTTIRLWNLSTGKCLRSFREHTNWVNSVAFSPDGRFLVSGSDDATVRLWDLSTGDCIRNFQGHTNWVRSVAFSPYGKFLASGSDDATILLWDLSTGDCIRNFQGHTNWVRSVAFSPDGKLLISGSDDATVRLWDISTGECLQNFQGHTQWVNSITFSPDGELLASGSDNDTTVRLWDITTGECLQNFQGHTSWVYSVAFSPNGELLASGSNDATICLWDLSTGKCLQKFEGHTQWVRSVIFSPDNKLLVSGGGDATVRLWNLSTGECLKSFQGSTSWVWSLALRSDGRILAIGSSDPVVRLWDLSTGECIHNLQDHTNWVTSVAFSPDGRILASGSSDTTIRLWDLSTGECIHNLQDHTNWIASVTFSPDGRILASGSSDTTIRLWDLSTGQCINIFQGHTGEAGSLAFSPDGKTLASGSADGTIRFWNVHTGGCITVLRMAKPYEGTNITGVKGLTDAQRSSMLALGAVNEGMGEF